MPAPCACIPVLQKGCGCNVPLWVWTVKSPPCREYPRARPAAPHSWFRPFSAGIVCGKDVHSACHHSPTAPLARRRGRARRARSGRTGRSATPRGPLPDRAQRVSSRGETTWTNSLLRLRSLAGAPSDAGGARLVGVPAREPLGLRGGRGRVDVLAVEVVEAERLVTPEAPARVRARLGAVVVEPQGRERGRSVRRRRLSQGRVERDRRARAVDRLPGQDVLVVVPPGAADPLRLRDALHHLRPRGTPPMSGRAGGRPAAARERRSASKCHLGSARRAPGIGLEHETRRRLLVV